MSDSSELGGWEAYVDEDTARDLYAGHGQPGDETLKASDSVVGSERGTPLTAVDQDPVTAPMNTLRDRIRHQHSVGSSLERRAA